MYPKLFTRGPLLASKITMDPHILANVNIELLYPKAMVGWERRM